MKLSIKVRDYDFGKIFASGLFYFFYNSAPERKISAPGKTAKLSFRQEKDKLIISSDKGLDGKTVERIKYCLGADENLDRFYKLCRRDKVLKKFLKKIEKTRIVSAFTDLEAMVGAVVSQNNSYRNYRTQMKRICDKTNFEKENILKNLKNFKVGYNRSLCIRAVSALQSAHFRRILRLYILLFRTFSQIRHNRKKHVRVGFRKTRFPLYYRLEYWNLFRAFGCPGFFLSTTRASLVSSPAFRSFFL